jgi:hypothetical protein
LEQVQDTHNSKYELKGQYMDLTKVHTRRRKEEEGGERQAPNKAGPTRPPLLIGIKWECKDMGMGYLGHILGIS